MQANLTLSFMIVHGCEERKCKLGIGMLELIWMSDMKIFI